MTYGTHAVGLRFNPSGDADVHRVKLLFAQIIDFCAMERAKSVSPEQKRHYSIAIIDAEAAQMRAVKAITWRDEGISDS